MAKRFLDVIGLEYFWNKIKALLNNKSDKGHTHSSSEVSGLSKVATTNDFNSLSNLPFYPASFNITWNGDTTDKTANLTSEVAGAGQIAYYNMSDEIVTSDKVIGAKVSYMFDTEQELTVTVSSVLFADDSTSGSFCIMLTDPIYLPLIICVQKPDTLSFTIEGVGSITITFTESGIYFVNFSNVYTTSFSKEKKTLDKEFIPDIYQEKLKCPQQDLGLCNSSKGYIYNYIPFIIGSNINEIVYDITTDSFVLPIFMGTTLNPTDGTITLKIATEIDSSLNVTDSISIDISCKTPLYFEKTYFLVAVKKSDETWSGWIVGKIDSPVDTTPTSDSENLITSGGVYTAINEAIGTALGGSY